MRRFLEALVFGENAGGVDHVVAGHVEPVDVVTSRETVVCGDLVEAAIGAVQPVAHLDVGGKGPAATVNPDAVVVGQDKPFIGTLFWPSIAGMQALAADERPGSPLEKLTAIIGERLAAFNATAGGSSRRVARFAVMTEPPSIDAGEITDKGYVNQRATIERRAALVDGLYANPPAEGVIKV